MIYLINAPFFSCFRPNMALALFKAHLNRAGLASKVLDLQLPMADHMGHSTYSMIVNYLPYTLLFGLYFTQYLWGDKFSVKTHIAARESIKAHYALAYRFKTGNCIADIQSDKWHDLFVNKSVPFLMQTALDLIPSSAPPKVVGISCMISQIIPSLALGKLIKQKYPHTKLVYGGACFHDEMGREHIEKIPWIDAVSTGETDDIVVDLFEALSQGRSPADLKGVVYRDSNGLVASGPEYRNVSEKVFESLPTPDYDDFFQMVRQIGLEHDKQWRAHLHLNIEGSRGCSWGQKCECMFCGLNGADALYRIKPADTVLTQISSLAEKYGVSKFTATDNTFPYDYFKTLIPNLIKYPSSQPIALKWEVRPNLNREQVIALAKANIRGLLVGIETLSTNLLKLLRKGTNAMMCIYFLKLCRQYGMEITWNYLVRIPGEQPEDYERIESLMPKIIHFHPPARCMITNVELIRFSPYHNEKKMVENIRPLEIYSYMYPSDRFDLSRLATFYEADWKDTLGHDAYISVNDAILRWCSCWTEQAELPNLSLKKNLQDNRLTIMDTRKGSHPRTIPLEPDQAVIYQMLDDPIHWSSLLTRLKNSDTPQLSDIHHVRSILDGFISEDLVVKEKNTYLGLALPHDIPDIPLDKRLPRFL